MHAVILVGHGALNKASGASMIRHAALLKNTEGVDFATAGFLNFSRPTFAEAAARCVAKGAARITIQPYFLINGYYVDTVLPKQVTEAKDKYPKLIFEVLKPFSNHPLLAEIVAERARSTAGALNALNSGQCRVLLIAHGTPTVVANVDIERVAARLANLLKVSVQVAYLECNEPSILDAVSDLASDHTKHIISVPYFLQAGRHVKEDIPRLIAAAQQMHTGTSFYLSRHLDFDPKLVALIEERLTLPTLFTSKM